MKFFLTSITLLFTLFISPHIVARQLSLDINDEAVRAAIASTPSREDLNFSASFLHHEDDGNVYALGAFVQSPINNRLDLIGSLGGRFYYLDPDGPGGFGLGLGGEIGFKIPTARGLSLHLEAYYAPKVLTFDDIERFIDISTRFKYQFLEKGAVYIGYRKQEVGTKGGKKVDIDKGGHIGITLQF